MIRAAAFTLVLLASPSIAAPDDPPPPAEVELAEHLDSLEALHDKLLAAADHVIAGRKGAARAALAEAEDLGLSERMMRKPRSMAQSLERLSSLPGLAEAPDYLVGHLARWFEQAEHPDHYRSATSRLNRGSRTEPPQKRAAMLVLGGRLAEARAELAAIEVPPTDESLARRIEDRIDRIDRVLAAEESPLELVKRTGRPYRDSLLRIRGLREIELPAEEEGARRRLLAEWLGEAGDEAGRRLVLRAIADASSLPQGERAAALLTLGNDAHRAKRTEDALTSWERVLTEFPDEPAWPKALFNTGVALKETGRGAEAIAAFERLLASDVNNEEPGLSLMETYRNYHHRAAWEIALVHLDASRYEKALAGFRDARLTYPARSWCGTCASSMEVRNLVYEGLCLEWLGRYREAAKTYIAATRAPLGGFGAPEVRLLLLYEAAGRTADLKKLAGELGGASRALSIHASWSARDFTTLIAKLEGAGGPVPGNPDDLERDPERDLIVRLLARNPERAVPLLIKALTKGEEKRRGHPGWILHALGRCGTETALRAISDHVREQSNYHQVGLAVFALAQAEDAASPFLDELAREGTRSVRHVVEGLRAGRMKTARERSYPPIPKDPDLP